MVFIIKDKISLDMCEYVCLCQHALLSYCSSLLLMLYYLFIDFIFCWLLLTPSTVAKQP
jgi:hypothetical protein